RHEHHRHPAADGGNAGVGAVAEPPRRLLQPLQEQVKTERAAKPGKWARIITSARLRRIYASTRPFLYNQDPERSSSASSSRISPTPMAPIAAQQRTRASGDRRAILLLLPAGSP